MCRLTLEKPQFKEKCPSKIFEENAHHSITQAIEPYESMKRTRPMVILGFWTYLTFALVLIGGAIALYFYLWNHGWLSVVPLVIGAAGVALLGYAFGPWSYYRSKMAINGDKLKKYEDLMAVYGITFEYDIEMVKDYQASPQDQAKCRNLRFVR